MDIIPPMFDVMFKRMFSENGSAPLLADFLQTYIDFNGADISNITLVDKEIKRYSSDKGSSLDLRVETGGAEIDIEIQIKELAGDRNRFALYLSKMFSDQIGEGGDYSKMHNCKSLLILDYTMPEYDKSNEFCHTFKMRDEKGVVFSDALEIGVVEIPRIRDLAVKPGMDKRILWAKLLAAKREEDLDMLTDATNDNMIKQAVFSVKRLSADQEMRLLMDAELKQKLDQKALEQTAELRGMAKGIAEGIAKGKAEGRAEGIAEGRAEGMAKGKAEGIAEGVDDLANALLSLGVNREKIEEAVRLLQNPQSPQEADTNEDSDDWDMNR